MGNFHNSWALMVRFQSGRRAINGTSPVSIPSLEKPRGTCCNCRVASPKTILSSFSQTTSPLTSASCLWASYLKPAMTRAFPLTDVHG